MDNKTCINPLTGRKIKINGKTFKKLQISIDSKDSYSDYRFRQIDPILHIKLPVLKGKEVFKFPFMWNPYNGNREELDKKGPLFFDPDTLIHYFYSNRVNHLIEKTDDNVEYYGSGVGKGPIFNIIGRGDHPDWYLFRLPIIDGYLNIKEWGQAVTMGPILTDDELHEIDQIAKTYGNNYYKLYKKPRPSLVELKKLYCSAIDTNPSINIDDEVIPFLTIEEIQKLQYLVNINAVKQLIYL
jgi:hypothetical protein